LATETDRTLFFDLLPLKLGKVGDFTTRIQLYTVPGQVFYNSTRKLVLKGVDGIVFVADSQEPMLDANIESLENLQENLQEQKLNLRKLPWVIQYNKRDLPGIMPVSVLNRNLNFMDVPYFESIATIGEGVMDTLLGISSLTLRHLKKKAGEKISDDDQQLQLVKEELLRSFQSGPSDIDTRPDKQKDDKKSSIIVESKPGKPDQPAEKLPAKPFDAKKQGSVPEYQPTIVPAMESEDAMKTIDEKEKVSVEIDSPEPVSIQANGSEAEGLIIDKNVKHKIRIPIKVVKTEDVGHVNLNLNLEIECILQTETIKRQESKAEKLASQALEDFLLGKSRKQKQ
jgi:mutual gliding-motility protein MglA